VARRELRRAAIFQVRADRTNGAAGFDVVVRGVGRRYSRMATSFRFRPVAVRRDWLL
jgi:hypothetical protein